ncbi:hypothetical protein C8F01DRAFT_1087274 [Mycena amicta]|nr:hypothetical protein C8F01DRAFT_1087274 [Mycena amicta]
MTAAATGCCSSQDRKLLRLSPTTVDTPPYLSSFSSPSAPFHTHAPGQGARPLEYPIVPITPSTHDITFARLGKSQYFDRANARLRWTRSYLYLSQPSSHSLPSSYLAGLVLGSPPLIFLDLLALLVSYSVPALLGCHVDQSPSNSTDNYVDLAGDAASSPFPDLQAQDAPRPGRFVGQDRLHGTDNVVSNGSAPNSSRPRRRVRHQPG